ncbi:hypothetical protein EWB00_002431, partial [Schistosoma japonicum]
VIVRKWDVFTNMNPYVFAHDTNNSTKIYTKNNKSWSEEPGDNLCELQNKRINCAAHENA